MATNTKGAYTNLRTGRTYYPNSRNYYARNVGYYNRRPWYSYRGYSYRGNQKRKGSDFKLFRSTPWLFGALVGLTDVDNKIPATAKVLAATMPVSGRIGGKIRGVGQGMCFGDVVQKNILPMLGIRIGAGASTGGNAGNYV